MLRKLARPMLASVFVASGADMIKNTAEHREGTQELLNKVRAIVPTEYHSYIPTDPDTVTRALGGSQAASAALLALGKAPRLTSATLAALTVPTMLSRYAFWETQDPKEKQERRNGLLTNTALLGGLMIATADTQGKPGLAWRAQHAGKQIQKQLPTKTEQEKFADNAKGFIDDASAKVTEYVEAATSYIDDNKDDWLDRAKEHSKTAKSGLVQAAAVAQDRANEYQKQAAKASGKYQKKAEKTAAKYQKKAEKTTAKAQKKFAKLDI
ncbi:DoxX family membrane protein [Corynebacterium epidermidicanis]|uniref:Putative membrane protein n=1 Tax=Corynebacterium epidermidicanis TaxID=1050174 RepID=A0A0G3GPC7_9CORY|nr:DoxX family membrane protein [Corynebacterium epidermidicanis]AKK03014.1 putative membrane protein [Corynebacterium epidermidicanis]